jgi:hypothetical protein
MTTSTDTRISYCSRTLHSSVFISALLEIFSPLGKELTVARGTRVLLLASNVNVLQLNIERHLYVQMLSYFLITETFRVVREMCPTTICYPVDMLMSERGGNVEINFQCSEHKYLRINSNSYAFD